MFWADELIKKIIKERKLDGYLVTDEKTPSGRVHVGALEGVLYHSTIARSLEKSGKKTVFQYGFDDYDPMDSLPIYIPKEYEKYMGIPLSEIPAPDGKGSFANYFADEFIEVINSLGIEPKIVYTSKMYKQGEFNQSIKIALNKANIVREIYKNIANQDRPYDWFPIQMICEKCHKIGTTRAYAWDGEKVSYECGENWVKYTQGCGHKGELSPLNGNSKLPWKVEWAAKWSIWKSDVEGAGKDHMTKNGSHDIASEIARQVYGIKTPEKFRYEFFLVGGKKMSSSKGLGNSAREVSEVLPAELLKYLIVRSNPKIQLNFNLDGKTISQLYNDFDRAHTQYITDPKSDEAKIYEYSKISQEVPEYLMRFSKIVSYIQISYLDIEKEAEKEKGSKLTEVDKKDLANRIKYARIYLEKFASEDEKFEIQKEIPKVKLNDSQKKLLEKIADLVARESEPEIIHNYIYETGKVLGLKPKETFETIYQIFLNKTSGPKAGWFLANLDKNFVFKRIKEASK
ncbi:MAG: Lysine-tRNA ligase [Berkelbacteria bacterium GW2011_GWA2_35_9]|uniref:Lysine--tRNA ligase n=1 Tax=Berkelbacteria bacterium GW2011_GWA2_35_9 TaxID=1618333 RepID=A0A0G0GBC2_9BACT|nr:MAG: Lysine-tRNA ligase [Berkelbacteria bacterium GW2011_GWA2_35_9]